ncbi:MAG TPA: hypothetical protein ENI23_11625 [bacterium]|nr:hypothetical protein [bacterium]
MKVKKIEIVLVLFLLSALIAGVLLSVFEKNQYLRSIELGGEWFLNNQDENFLHYTYNPITQEHSTDHHPLREMASMWVIGELGIFLEDERYSDLTRRGFDYFEAYFSYDEENDFYFVQIPGEEPILGNSAFIILSLLQIEHPKKDFYLEKFANGIMFLQRDNGSLGTKFYSEEDGSEDYYPGEALFAIMYLYEYDQNEEYLETATKAFPYYSDYWRGNNNTAFVPWQSRAYEKLYKVTKEEQLAEFVFEMNDYMLEQHNPNGVCSDFDFSKGSVTGVYAEGVNRAYSLSKSFDDSSRRKCYKNFIVEGMDAIIDLQVRNISKYELEALGGISQSTDNLTMRVDRNQHVVMALIEAYELGLLGE